MKQFYSLLFMMCCLGLGLNAQVTIASQDFDALSGSTFCTDQVGSGIFLTNTASFNSGGGGLDFSTVWFQSRSNTLGPVNPNDGDSNDFIGVNDFGGSNAPDVGPDGTSVSTNKNFQFNDGDGLLSLRFENIDMSGFTNRTLSFDYWINDTGYEPGDAFIVNITDGTITTQVLGFNDGLMESNSSADNGTANWMSFSMNIDSDIAGFDDTQIEIQIGVDNNSGTENVFVDNIEVTGDEVVVSSVLINELEPNPPGSDPGTQSIEILGGLPGTNFDLWAISLENDGYNGTVDEVNNITGTFDANGIGVATIDDLENPTFTLILTDAFTGSLGDDLDAGDNGTLDLSSFGNILDAVSVSDAAGDDATLYAASIGGTNILSTGAGEPEIIFRDGTTGTWYATDEQGTPFAIYDENGNLLSTMLSDWDSNPTATSFGAVNPSYDPSTGGGCAITNVVITNLECGDGINADESFFDISFDVTGGSGVQYNILNPASGVAYSVIPSTTTDGTVSGVGSASSAAAEGSTAQLIVVDASNANCVSNPVSIDVPVCPTCSAGAGDLVISEVFQNPGFPELNDSDAEYIEVYNPTGSDVEMAGMVLRDDDFDSHTIGSSLIVPAGGYVLLMRNGNTAVNGGLTASYVYGDDIQLANGSDEVVIECNGTIVDQIAYDNGATFPDPNGASMSLNPDFLDAASNDNGANWCESTTEYFTENFGTPGGANDNCCDIAINGTSTTEDCPGVGGSISIFASCPSCDGIKYSINGGASYQASNTFTGLSAGNYNVVVMDAGSSGCMDMATVNVPEPGTAVPAPWATTDVGSSGAAGNAYAFDSCEEEFTVIGGGNNAFPGTNTDAVAFINQTLCGDGEIVAKLESLTPNGYGGLMMRETNAANAKQVAIFSDLTNVLRHEARSFTGGNKVIQAHYRPNPFWLKLVRQGNWFFAYYSTTGSNFQYIHAVNVPMNTCIQIGLASFTFFPGQQCTAVFSNVSVSGGTGVFAEEDPVQGLEFSTEKVQPSTLYPNPATNLVNIELGTAREQATTLLLRNELGQVVEQRRLEVPAVKEVLDVSGLNNGMYFIEVVTEGREREVLRFIKTQ